MSRLFAMIAAQASFEYSVLTLRSFQAMTKLEPTDRFLVIDNESDERIEALLKGSQGVQLARRKQPASFAENANLALQLAAKQEADLILLNNDIFFSPGWCEALCSAPEGVVAANGNQNIAATAGAFSLKPTMIMEDLRGNEAAFFAIAKDVAQKKQNYLPALKTNFFAVRIPKEVYEKLGFFDTRFGIAGGEDDDYCVRAHLAGIPVLVAEHCFLLHFAGKSSWDGPESKEEWQKREEGFVSAFQDKWGPRITQLLLKRDSSIISDDPKLAAIQQRYGSRGLLLELLHRDGRLKAREEEAKSEFI